MEKAKTTIKNLLSNKKVLVIGLLAVIFIVAAVYAYKTYAVPRINPEYVSNSEFVKADGLNQSADIYFFYTEWCPHCKKAKPEWQQFKNKIDSKMLSFFILMARNYNFYKDFIYKHS